MPKAYIQEHKSGVCIDSMYIVCLHLTRSCLSRKLLVLNLVEEMVNLNGSSNDNILCSNETLLDLVQCRC